MTKSVFSTRYDRFREALIAARTRADLTQVEVAKRLAKPQSFVSKYERGERRLDVVEFLDVARVLGLDPHKLLREIDPRPEPARKRR